jgi:THO complex subunit 1
MQLSDLAFRRHILVQALILIQFLLSFTEKAKKKMASRTQQKTAFTLSEEDVRT